MSDINILNENLAEGILIALASTGLFYLIFLYHIINGSIKASKQNLKIKQTLSYGYIVGGVILFGLQSLFVLGFTIDVKNRIVQDIVAGAFMILLFLSPVMILLFGYFYNRLKNKSS